MARALKNISWGVEFPSKSRSYRYSPDYQSIFRGMSPQSPEQHVTRLAMPAFAGFTRELVTLRTCNHVSSWSRYMSAIRLLRAGLSATCGLIPQDQSAQLVSWYVLGEGIVTISVLCRRNLHEALALVFPTSPEFQRHLLRPLATYPKSTWKTTTLQDTCSLPRQSVSGD